MQRGSFTLPGEAFLNALGPAYHPVNERISLSYKPSDNSLVAEAKKTAVNRQPFFIIQW